MPCSRNTLAILETRSYNSLYVICNAASFGSFGSKIMAVLSPRLAKCLSIQFLVMFTFAFKNHLKLASCISTSKTLSHF